MQNTREGGGIPGFLDHFGGICMYLQGIQSQRSDDFRGGGRADQKIAGWTALSSPCCYLEDIGRLKTTVNYTSQVIPRLRMDICFEKVWSKMYIFFATPKNC